MCTTARSGPVTPTGPDARGNQPALPDHDPITPLSRAPVQERTGGSGWGVGAATGGGTRMERGTETGDNRGASQPMFALEVPRAR
ncbi:MAG TPA: hypothetical protein VH482_02850, partial [Thermomicrobiales bacterium]